MCVFIFVVHFLNNILPTTIHLHLDDTHLVPSKVGAYLTDSGSVRVWSSCYLTHVHAADGRRSGYRNWNKLHYTTRRVCAAQAMPLLWRRALRDLHLQLVALLLPCWWVGSHTWPIRLHFIVAILCRYIHSSLPGSGKNTERVIEPYK